MLRFSLFASVACLIVSFPGLAAQPDTPFGRDSICDEKTGFVDRKKFFAAAIKDINIADVLRSDDSIDKKALSLRVRGHLTYFKTEYLDKGVYYKLTPASITAEELITKLGQYQIECIKQADSAASEIRAGVDSFTKAVGSNLVLGKDLDALTKPLNTRNPAKFSVTRDKFADNTALQTEFALAGIFDADVTVNNALFTGGGPHTVFLGFYPFIVSQTMSNSNVKLTDIDKVTFGMMFNAFSIPFFGLGTNHLSGRVGYQSDSAITGLTDKTYEATVGELVWWPQFGFFQALKLGERIRFGGSDGIWFRHDLSGRLRAGDIHWNTSIPTLPKEGDYVRVGYRYELGTGLFGNDFFSKFAVSASYLYFDNRRGANGIDEFYKLGLELKYEVTDNYGFSISYSKGRDEDILKGIEQVVAALTVKFGEGKLPP